MDDAAEKAAWNAWNVVRVEDSGRVCLLEYESFDLVAFPRLLESRLVYADGRVARRDFRSSSNPPILHRKELLLPQNHPRIPEFSALTAELEARGLFVHANRIGTQRAWDAKLKEAGIAVKNHSIEEFKATSNLPPVHRHKTAIVRQGLSVPMQSLVRAGIIVEGRTVFDYGCGRGDDIAALSSLGVVANGWDPHWRPKGELIEADIVNLGFVLNVIESPEERIETARRAFSLARICMCVGVMLVGKTDVRSFRRLGDGYLSHRGTFQRYFTQAEIKSFLERSLGLEAIAVGSGVFFVFRDKIEEQRFLARRYRRYCQVLDASAPILSAPPHQPSRPEVKLDYRQHRLTMAASNRDTLAALWAVTLDLGRPPVEDEVCSDLSSAIAESIGSMKRALGLAVALFGRAQLDAASQARREDLAVYFALNAFNKRQAYGRLPAELQRDVRAFFGSLKDANASGRELLFSLGRSETIEASCRQAASAGLGHLGDGSLLVDARLASRLPAPLRAYIGCAEKLFGSVDSADVLKIHIGSGKLTLLKYEDYVESPVPRLIKRIKINLKEQDWDEFQYGDGREDRTLVLKSLLMSPDLKDYEAQSAFDARVQAAIPLLDGPTDLPTEIVERALGRVGLGQNVFNRKT